MQLNRVDIREGVADMQMLYRMDVDARLTTKNAGVARSKLIGGRVVDEDRLCLVYTSQHQAALHKEELNSREEYLKAKEDYDLAVKKHALISKRLKKDAQDVYKRQGYGLSYR